MRLDRFISEHTEYTRSEIKTLVRKGFVKINGISAKDCGMNTDPENSVVEICGKIVNSQKHRYIILNKPSGYVCSTDPKDGKTVMELLPKEIRNKNMFPAGRLDKDSLGLLLITDDGELAHKMLSPKKHVPKIYIVKLDRTFEEKYINIFEKGIELGSGEVCMPAKARGVENCEKLAFVELREGKFHQIKRMFSALGNNVEVLMRVSLGGLIIPETLGFGEHMELLHKDVDKIFYENDFEQFLAKFSPVFSAILINKH